VRQIPDRPLASRGRLPSDIDGDAVECKCEHCGRWMDRDKLTQDHSPTRGLILVCEDCNSGWE
jgi:hypothetical protein